MKRHSMYKLFVLLLITAVVGFDAISQTPIPNQPSVAVPQAPSLAAKSYILMDYHSGAILSESNKDQQLEPASITKMMTAYVVFSEIKSGNLALTDMVTVSEKAWRTGGSKMFIEVGKKVSVEDLIRGMIIQSGNDACVALAEHIAGSEEVFASLMNQHAAKIGMRNSSFANATGLPSDGHLMTAQDIALLGKAIITEFPSLYSIYSEKQFTFNNITQHNRNTLLWRDPTVDGFKTGHTDAAGYCLATSAMRNGMRLMSVVMGTESEQARADETQKLINYGFRFFETHKLYNAGDERLNAEVWKGKAENVSIGLSKDLFITIPKGQYQNLKATVDMPSLLTAPIAQGTELGRLQIDLQGNTIAILPLVSLETVEQSGWWGRTMDSIGLWFKSDD
ncbi:D-alanyl-D-alanine carboxypeptidase family protein [Marinicella sp. W31]|uniref:D-alanyl-D-alanine carboxypeptidase family protein n=1 Tax=Marinicella sp. W31 TaxID=3023713 RepID=UPI0037579717